MTFFLKVFIVDVEIETYIKKEFAMYPYEFNLSDEFSVNFFVKDHILFNKKRFRVDLTSAQRPRPVLERAGNFFHWSGMRSFFEDESSRRLLLEYIDNNCTFRFDDSGTVHTVELSYENPVGWETSFNINDYANKDELLAFTRECNVNRGRGSVLYLRDGIIESRLTNKATLIFQQNYSQKNSCWFFNIIDLYPGESYGIPIGNHYEKTGKVLFDPNTIGQTVLPTQYELF